MIYRCTADGHDGEEYFEAVDAKNAARAFVLTRKVGGGIATKIACTDTTGYTLTLITTKVGSGNGWGKVEAKRLRPATD